ncbi:MAG: hypothetical protein Q9196_002889 [Gyalolechia fulgens]
MPPRKKAPPRRKASAPPPPVEDEEPTQPPTQRRKREPSEPHPNTPTASKIFLKFADRGCGESLEQPANSQVPPVGSNISKRRANMDNTRRDALPEDPDEPDEREEEEQTADEADVPNTFRSRTPVAPLVIPADIPAVPSVALVVVVDPVDVKLDDPPIPNEPEVFEFQLTVIVYYNKERLDHDVLCNRKLVGLEYIDLNESILNRIIARKYAKEKH